MESERVIRKSKLSGQIAKEYLERFPETPTLTLAKLIYKDNVEVFKDVEHARKTLRIYRGQNGEQARDLVKDKRFFKEAGSYAPFRNLPKGEKYFPNRKPIKITGLKSLILGDVHARWHDERALYSALEFGYKNGADTIILLGDFMDHYEQSNFQKDPRKKDYPKEIEVANQILSEIRGGFDEAEIYYLLGNHEDRYERYLQVKAPELCGCAYVDFSKVVNSEKHGIKLVRNRNVLKIGTLNVIHGHEWGKGATVSPVNPARTYFMRAGENCLGAHYHTSSSHAKKTISGDIIGCWSIGCLSGLEPDYAPLNNWNHGFALVERDGHKFEVSNKKIIDGKVYGS